MASDDRISSAMLLDWIEGRAKQDRTLAALARQREASIREIAELKSEIAELKAKQGVVVEIQGEAP